ncbi:MAG TPA: ABC transporter substrate-binding protein [Reyranella sp.]
MAKLTLSVAVGDYDRTRPLIDGAVQIDGVDPVIMTLSPEEIFFRAFREAPFDICELSLSSFAVKSAAGNCPYVGVPAFLSRAFRHTSIYVRKDRVARPQDLKGRRMGVAEYQLTANVWARALLADHGVSPSDVVWVRGGLEEPGRIEKVAVALPTAVRLEAAPEGATLAGLLAEGKIDGVISPRAPSCHEAGHPDVGWLFDDPTEAAKDYYRRTRIFPIMHLVGVRRELAERHPWLPAAVLKAFTAAKAAALRHLGDTAATKATLPFVEEQLRDARQLMGPDFWSYGLGPSRHVLDAFLQHHHDQGLSPRLVRAEELFHASTHETVKV